MYAEYDYDYTRLTPYVSSDVATQAVADMRDTHEMGVNFRGLSVIVETAFADDSATEVDVCVDSRGVEAFDVESGAIWEATSSQITPWRLSTQVNARGEVIVTAQESLEAESSSVCADFS
ncbi:hypothetical protein [Agrococcus jejuensis]|uniref:hypothetical protein n=1 Tax=Agrococcus jejuensis TaxID=399736 RepID=UPI0011A6A242|nr:hypothetical protein [Agrococcus jejuensis]